MPRVILARTVLPAAVAALTAVAMTPQAAHAADPVGPAQTSFLLATAYSAFNETALPPGTNDFSCKPTAKHPRPVVLVHGTFSNRYGSFAMLAPALKAEGYCVFALNYGNEDDSLVGKFPGVFGTAGVKPNSQEVSTFVDQVRSATGTSQVDMFGWSQGGIVIRSYLKFYGGADASNPANNKVKNVAMFGATNHGTTLSGLGALAGAIIPGAIPPLLGQAATDQLIDSSFQQELNAGGDTQPGINYTVIGSKYDEVSTPYTRTFMTAGPGATVNNITLQDGCGIDFSDHLSGMYSHRMVGLTKKALDPSSTAAIPCRLNLPVL